MRIDAHQHFWVYNKADYGWIGDNMGAIRRDFLPGDLQMEQAKIGFCGSVAVQARQSLAETHWLLSLAERWDFIKGVVGWVDLQAGDVGEQLAELAEHRRLVGVRHVVHDEPDRAFMLRPQFLRGLGLLRDFNLTYDLLLFPQHLPVARRVAERFPEQRFVLDHLAKPAISRCVLSPWDRDIRALAKCPNVYCKLSGMVTEARWGQWQEADFRPYLDVVFEAFGVERLMIGSDWPVCTLSGTYEAVMGITIDYVSNLARDDQELVLGTNAGRFYGLEV